MKGKYGGSAEGKTIVDGFPRSIRIGSQCGPAEQKNTGDVGEVQEKVDQVVPGGVGASNPVIKKISQVGQLPSLCGVQNSPHISGFCYLRARQKQAVIEVKRTLKTAPVHPCGQRQSSDDRNAAQTVHLRVRISGGEALGCCLPRQSA